MGRQKQTESESVEVSVTMLREAAEKLRTAATYLERLGGAGIVGKEKEVEEEESGAPDAYWSGDDEAYICNYDGCKASEEMAFDMPSLLKHLKKDHEVEKPVIQELQDSDKKFLKGAETPKTKRKVVKAVGQKVRETKRIGLLDLQKIALPTYAGVKVKVEPCPKKCPNFGRKDCTPEKCGELQRRLSRKYGNWRTVYYVANRMDTPK